MGVLEKSWIFVSKGVGTLMYAFSVLLTLPFGTVIYVEVVLHCSCTANESV